MWARWLEILLGVWLLASPLVLPPRSDGWIDPVAGASIVLISSLSFARRLHRAHLVLIPLSLALFFQGWMLVWQGPGAPLPGATQNRIMVALTVCMLAVVPSSASQPPTTWQRKEHGEWTQ